MVGPKILIGECASDLTAASHFSWVYGPFPWIPDRLHPNSDVYFTTGYGEIQLDFTENITIAKNMSPNCI